MTDSIGAIQLDIEVSDKSLDRERERISKSFENMFNNLSSGPVKNFASKFSNIFSTFISKSLGKTNNEATELGDTIEEVSAKASKSVNKLSNDYDKISSKIKALKEELKGVDLSKDNIVSGYMDMPNISGSNKDETIKSMLKNNEEFQKLDEKGKELADTISKLEGEQEKLNSSMNTMAENTEKASRSFSLFNKEADKADSVNTKNTRGFKLFTKEVNNSNSSLSSFTNMINSTIKTVLRRIFVYSLIMKGIRGIISHMTSALKTNSAFNKSLNTIKTNLLVAFAPIYNFILPALNALMSAIATVTTYIASAISALFGSTYKQSYNTAKGIEQSKKAMLGFGGAAKKAGKEAKKASMGLLSFDDVISVKQDDSSQGDTGGGGGGAPGFDMAMPDTSTIDLSGIEKFKELLEPTIDALKRLGNALDPLKNFVATGLKDFYGNFLVPVGKWVFGQGLPRFIDAITNGLMKINWQPINDGLNSLWKALTPFAINVGEGLLWFWENVLVPLAVWTINDVLPVFLEALAGAINLLNSIIEVFKPLGQWFFDKFLYPLAKWTGGAIVDILDGLGQAFNAIAKHIDGVHKVIADSDSFLNALVDVGIYLVEGLYKGIISAISGIVNWLWNNLVSPIINAVKRLFGINSPSTVFAEIGVWLVQGLFLGISKTWTIIVDYFSEKLNNLILLFSETWNEITNKSNEVWELLKEYFSETWNSIKDNATEIWTLIKDFFSETWDSISNKTSETWNNIKEFLFNNIWEPIKIKAKNTWDNSRSNIVNPITTTKNNLNTLWDNIK
ncbi:MAG TPA: hypothetical protein VIG40_03670, partial [Tissierellaceae bacterium]